MQVEWIGEPCDGRQLEAAVIRPLMGDKGERKGRERRKTRLERMETEICKEGEEGKKGELDIGAFVYGLPSMAIRRSSSLGLSAMSYLILLAELGLPTWGRWRGRCNADSL